MPNEPTTYPPGTVIADRYRIESVLGIGGFGAVYKCVQLNMNQAVAVKVLKMEHITSDEHVRRFEREARAASKLRHPNTISIFDFGTHDDGALFLAMEYLEGETLADRLEGGRMPAPELVHIMTQVCHSLTEAHNAGLVHRDLKPENIMLMSVAGDPNFVKVLDFGIAKVDDESSAHEEKLTEMGMIMGTPQYMSPEQAYGYKLDPRSDVYALGVLMYEALTGRVPFEGEKPMEVLLKHINDPPLKPTQVEPRLALPRALERAVLQCLEKQRDDRPQTTLDLAGLLNKALHTPDNRLRRGTPEDPAPPQEAVTAHVEELAVAAGVEAELVPSRRPSSGDLRPRPASSGSSALWLGLAAFAVVAIVAVAIALLAIPDQPAASPVAHPHASPRNPTAAAVLKPAGATTAGPRTPSATPPSQAPRPPLFPKATSPATPAAATTPPPPPKATSPAAPEAATAPAAAADSKPKAPAAASRPSGAPRHRAHHKGSGTSRGGREGHSAGSGASPDTPATAPKPAPPGPAPSSDDFRLPD